MGAAAAGRQRDGQGAGAGVPVAEDAGHGGYATIEDLARAKDVNATYVSRVLRLTLLAPDIVEAILDGRQPAELGLDDLLDAFPLEWEAAARTLGEQGPFHFARPEEVVTDLATRFDLFVWF